LKRFRSFGRNLYTFFEVLTEILKRFSEFWPNFEPIMFLKCAVLWDNCATLNALAFEVILCSKSGSFASLVCTPKNQKVWTHAWVGSFFTVL
jgi:hypothetical protein